eukprot:2242879-Pyramimonas_sp.AAC.1
MQQEEACAVFKEQVASISLQDWSTDSNTQLCGTNRAVQESAKTALRKDALRPYILARTFWLIRQSQKAHPKGAEFR